MKIICSGSIKCGENLESALAELAAIGFKEIDLLTIGAWAHINPRNLHENWDTTINHLDSLLKKYALTPLALNSGTTVQLHARDEESNQIRREELTAITKLMNHLNVKIAAIQPLQKDRERPWDKAFKDCIESLHEQKEIGEKAGVTFALEAHINGPIESIDEARQFWDIFPEMPLTYDPTHFIVQGSDTRETKWMLDKAVHIHIRDAAKGKIQVPFGEGDVDFEWILKSLRDRGYDGLFSLEPLQLKGEEHNCREDVKRMCDLIHTYF